jgi:hypothetical protein
MCLRCIQYVFGDGGIDVIVYVFDLDAGEVSFVMKDTPSLVA